MINRKLKRRHLIYYLRVYERQTNVLLGHLVDISTDGIMIISEEPIAVGVDFHLKMVMPGDTEGSRQIVLEAQSLWSKKDVNPDFYANGFKVKKIDNNDIDILEHLIEQFGFND